MEALYHRTGSMLEDIQRGFSHLEKSTGDAAIAMEKDLQEDINKVIANCERLQMMAGKEPPQRRQNAKLRVDQLEYDNRHLQSALRSLQQKRCLRERDEREREDLMKWSESYRPNSAEDTAIAIDHSLNQNMSLGNANRGVDELIDSGNSILYGLRDQRETLKGAHRKLLDLANTLGMSNTVLRLIERRAYQDKYVLLGGMVITCVVMFLVLKYLT